MAKVLRGTPSVARTLKRRRKKGRATQLVAMKAVGRGRMR